jgi:hypothetical protein
LSTTAEAPSISVDDNPGWPRFTLGKSKRGMGMLSKGMFGAPDGWVSAAATDAPIVAATSTPRPSLTVVDRHALLHQREGTVVD